MMQHQDVANRAMDMHMHTNESDSDGGDGEEGGKDGDKARARRERNKLAARRCRWAEFLHHLLPCTSLVISALIKLALRRFLREF